MKRWYCPHCDVFKRTSKKWIGIMAYPATYHCRCCGTEMINTKEFLDRYFSEIIQQQCSAKKQ